MRSMFSLTVAAAAAILFLGCGSTEEAGESPGTDESSTITIRFVNDGQPVDVILGARVNEITADGKDCGPSGLGVVILRRASGYVRSWPMTPEKTVNEECANGPPTELTFMFAHERGPFIATVNWQGEDVTVDLEIPAEAVAAPES